LLLEVKQLHADARAVRVARRMAMVASFGLVVIHLAGELLRVAFRAWSVMSHAGKVGKLLVMLEEAHHNAGEALVEAAGPVSEGEGWRNALVEYSVTASALAKSKQRVESTQARAEWAAEFARLSGEQWRRLFCGEQGGSATPVRGVDQNHPQRRMATMNDSNLQDAVVVQQQAVDKQAAAEPRLLRELEEARIGLEVALSPLPDEEPRGDVRGEEEEGEEGGLGLDGRPWAREEEARKASPHYHLYHELGNTGQRRRNSPKSETWRGAELRFQNWD